MKDAVKKLGKKRKVLQRSHMQLLDLYLLLSNVQPDAARCSPATPCSPALKVMCCGHATGGGREAGGGDSAAAGGRASSPGCRDSCDSACRWQRCRGGRPRVAGLVRAQHIRRRQGWGQKGEDHATECMMHDAIEGETLLTKLYIVSGTATLCRC